MARIIVKIGSVFTVVVLVIAVFWTYNFNWIDNDGLRLNEDEVSVVAGGERSLVNMLLQGDYNDEEYYVDEIEYPDALQYELETWINVIDTKLNVTLDNLQRDVDLEVHDLITQENNTVWTPFLIDWEKTQLEQESLIQEYINNIKCVGHWNNITNAMEYYNHDGVIISQYITRPLVDTLITRSMDELNVIYNIGNMTLNTTFTDKLGNVINTTLQTHIEMYENWGESVITEWSERMAQNDLLVDRDSIPYEYWRQFLEAKERVVEKHSELLEYKPTTITWNTFLAQCNDTLHSTRNSYNSHITALKGSAMNHFLSRDKTEQQDTTAAAL